MTCASSPAPARVHTQPALSYAAIRARAAELGMLETTLNELTGVTLGTLERDPDQRGIGLPLLTRLAAALDLPLDDLVVTADPAPHPARQAQQGDDVILLALLACYSGLATQRVLDLLGWTPERLDTALATIGTHLAPTALRVAATDHRLTLTLRPGALPALLRNASTPSRPCAARWTPAPRYNCSSSCATRSSRRFPARTSTPPACTA